MSVTLTVNGTTHTLDVADDTPLLWVLRDHLNLTGTKYACGVMVCGACTVLIDGEARRTCGLPVASVKSTQHITTIEGLPGPDNHPVQKAWAEHSVAQCGYCQSGMIMSATAMLNKNPDPDDQEIQQQMDNICRCGTYQLVKLAIKQAAEEMRRG